MKSGPTLNGATRLSARRSAPIKPVATVVFPLPDAGAAMTTAGTLTPVAFSVEQTQSAPFSRRIWAFRVCSRAKSSPLDALLALPADVHRVLDLRHLRHQVRGVKQRLRRITARDDDVLRSGPRRQHREHIVDVDPPPFQRIGELVEHIEVVPLLGEPP